MRTRLLCLLATLATATAALVAVTTAPAGADVTGTGGDYVQLSTTGLLADTRTGTGVPKAAMGPAGTVTVPVLGYGGVPSSGVSAVLVTLSAYSPTANTWLDMYASGTSYAKDTSNLNIYAGTAMLSNAAAVKVGADGKIAIYNSAGSVNVAVTVQGYYTTSTASTGPGGFTPVFYNRVLDTRSGLGATKAKVAAGGSVSFTVISGSVPSTADSVYLDLMVYGATAAGYLSESPYGTTSSRSVMEFTTGTTSHGVAVKPASGKITVVNHSSAAIDLLATQEGYTSASSTTGSGFHPARLRLMAGTSVPANGIVTVSVIGRPAVPTQHVTGAVLSLAASSTGAGYLRAWGTGNTEPSASALSFPASNVRAGMAVVGLAGAGSITVRNTATVATSVWVDLLGWFSDEHRSVGAAAFTPTVALQLVGSGTAPGALEYSYVDNVGRLLVGYQASLDNFGAVSWSTVSTLGDVLTGMPNLNLRPDGTTVLNAEYTDTGIRTKTQASGSSSWSGFFDTGGSFSGPPSTAALPTGGLYSFAVDDAGALWIRADGASTSWVARSISPALAGTPTVVTVGNGIQVFAVTTDGRVLTANYQGGASLSAWTDLGGTGVTDRPAVAVRPGYLCQVVIRQGDGSVATKAQASDGSWPAAWSPVDSIAALGAPAAVFDPVTGQIEILVRGSDGQIYNSGETVQGSQTWRAWQPASKGEVSATDPTIATFTGSSNGDGWVAPYRNTANATRVIVRSYTGGAAFAAAHPSFQTMQPSQPPAN